MENRNRTDPARREAGAPTADVDARARPRGGGLDPLRDLLYRWIRWSAARLRGVYAVLGLFLSLGLLATGLAVAAFAAIGRALAGGYMQQADVALMRAVERVHSPQLDVLALEVTSLGSVAVVTLVALVASALLWTSDHRYSVLLLWTAVVGAVVLNLALKAGFDRPRPEIFDWRTPYAGQASFPSGHAMLSMVVYWTLAFLVSRLERPRLLRILTWSAALGLIVLIGASRVYIGVHYPSDVVAGFVAGFAWASICAAGIEVIRYHRHREPRVRRNEADLEHGTPLAHDRRGT